MDCDLPDILSALYSRERHLLIAATVMVCTRVRQAYVLDGSIVVEDFPFLPRQFCRSFKGLVELALVYN